MGKDQPREGKHDAYQDFLTDISGQFGGRDEEKDFLNSISSESPREDTRVNVGERLKKVRKRSRSESHRCSPANRPRGFPAGRD